MAQAILLKDVETLGEAGDAVDVSPGYLRNYLVPRKLAQPATDRSLEEAQRRREVAEQRRPGGGRARRARQRRCWRKTVLTIQHRAGEDGKLYGSVTAPRSPTRSPRRAGSRSTAARSTSTTRSARSAPTWSRSSSRAAQTASVKTIVAEQK